MHPSVGLGRHSLLRQNFCASLSLGNFLLVSVVTPDREIDFVSAAFDMSFGPPADWLETGIAGEGCLMTMTIIASGFDKRQ